MNKCNDCGRIFNDDETRVWREDMGEHFGAGAYETFSGCPSCGGDYETFEYYDEGDIER